MPPESTSLMMFGVSLSMFILAVTMQNINERGLQDYDVPIIIVFGSLVVYFIFLNAVSTFVNTYQGG